MYVGLSLGVYSTYVLSFGCQKRVAFPGTGVTEVVVCHLVWVLGTELTSAKTAGLAPFFFFSLNICLCVRKQIYISLS